MKRTLTLSSVLLTLLLVLTACAGGGASPAPATTGPASPTAAAPTDAPTGEPTEDPEPTEGAPTADPGASPTASPPPAGEEGTLTLWVDEIRAPYMLELGQAFETEYGVPVAVHQLGFGDIRDQLQLRGPAGEGPDIIIGAHDWLGQLVDNGLVAPLDLGDKSAMVNEVALQAFTYDGELYGLPYASEAIALYYNTELVPEAPATWDELKQIALQLQEDGEVEQGYVLQTGPADPYHSYPILSGHGGYIFGRDDAGSYDPSDVGLDSEGGLAYANELNQLITDGVLRADVNYDTMISLFLSGDSAMFMTGPWALPQLREAGVAFDVAPIPMMDEQPRPFVGVQGFMVSAFAPEGLLAQTFLSEYVATDETMATLFEADPRPPTWLAQAEAIDDEQVLAFAESAGNGDPMPAIPEMSAVWTDWTDALNLIFAQSQDPEEAMTDAAESIRTTIGAE